MTDVFLKLPETVHMGCYTRGLQEIAMVDMLTKETASTLKHSAVLSSHYNTYTKRGGGVWLEKVGFKLDGGAILDGDGSGLRNVAAKRMVVNTWWRRL